jgi:transposase
MHLGIDVGKKKLNCALLERSQAGKERSRSKVVENTRAGIEALEAWLRANSAPPGSCRVCMEATSTYYEAVAEGLHAAGYQVAVINPLRIKAYGQSLLTRQKTDDSDAVLIARFSQANEAPAWAPPAPEIRELQRLVARLEAVVGMRVAEQTRLHESAGAARASVERLLATLQAEEKALEQAIAQHIDRHPPLKKQRDLLKSIPAVGDKLSAHFLCLPIERLDRAKQAVAFVGLSPKHTQSGSSVRGKTRIAKMGHARMRKMLYMPALCALKHNPAIIEFAKRLKANGKTGKVLVAAVMRKLLQWMFAVVKHQLPFDLSLALAKS